jgi:hypothetical protein
MTACALRRQTGATRRFKAANCIFSQQVAGQKFCLMLRRSEGILPLSSDPIDRVARPGAYPPETPQQISDLPVHGRPGFARRLADHIGSRK